MGDSSKQLKHNMENDKPNVKLDGAAEFQAKLKLMRQKFSDGLPERIQELNAAWQEFVESGHDIKHISVLHRLVHTLTGTAGTFSYKKLSIDARALEIMLKDILDEGVQPTSDQQGQISKMLFEIEASSKQDLDIASNDTPIAPFVSSKTGWKILIVDDDEDLNALLSSQLVHFGYEVASITSLSDLRKSLINFKPDLVILDISFPEGGLAGIQETQDFDFEKYVGHFVPTIYISARQDLEARLEVVRAGGSAYLTKPINISILLERVRELINPQQEQSARVLVIDDDHSLVELIRYLLTQVNLKVQTVTDPKQALEAISKEKPDLILMDVHMPWCSGIELAQVIRQHMCFQSIPIVFLSSESDKDVHFNAVLKGGDDFLTKPFDVNVLPLFIKAKAVRAKAISAMMIKDGLTGLYNHTYIKELIHNEMYRSFRSQKTFCIAMIDVDHFKDINDTYGHTIGDQVLRSLSHFLLQRLRKTDSVGRYGGEEFMLLLPDTSGEDALHLVQDILKGFSEVEHHPHDYEAFKVTFSAGVISSDQESDGDSLIESVDKVLYEAKEGGRNQALLYNK